MQSHGFQRIHRTAAELPRLAALPPTRPVNGSSVSTGDAASGNSASPPVRSGPPSLPAGIISGASDPLAAVNDEVNEEKAAGPHQAAKQGGRSCHARTASCGPGAGLLRRRCTRAPGKTPGRARTFSECPRKRTGNNGRPKKVNERGADLFHSWSGSWYGPVRRSDTGVTDRERDRSSSCRWARRRPRDRRAGGARWPSAERG